ncbi:MAG TPA: hypothetical protein VK689_22210 [Armatimonadota bacterium]|nr:hypothetical protein [Armatimonadota bacterium]
MCKISAPGIPFSGQNPDEHARVQVEIAFARQLLSELPEGSYLRRKTEERLCQLERESAAMAEASTGRRAQRSARKAA